jgi:hypothetical protein
VRLLFARNLDQQALWWAVGGGNVAGLAWFGVVAWDWTTSTAGPVTLGLGALLASFALAAAMLIGPLVASAMAAAVSRCLYWVWALLPLAITYGWSLAAEAVDKSLAPTGGREIFLLLIWTLVAGPISLYRFVRGQRCMSANEALTGQEVEQKNVWPPPPVLVAIPQEPKPPVS